jgi:hypothetical protein
MATLEDLGNVGELISGIAVLLTLIYLAYQTRQNSKLLEQSLRAQLAQMSSQNTDGMVEFQRDMISNKKLALVVNKLGTKEVLNEGEQLIASPYLQILFLRLENLAAQATLSGFDPATVDTIISRQIGIVSSSPYFISWWEERSEGWFSTGFSEKVNSHLSQGGT